MVDRHEAKLITTYMEYRGNISKLFPSISEANASELLENVLEMFPSY